MGWRWTCDTKQKGSCSVLSNCFILPFWVRFELILTIYHANVCDWSFYVWFAVQQNRACYWICVLGPWTSFFGIVYSAEASRIGLVLFYLYKMSTCKFFLLILKLCWPRLRLYHINLQLRKFIYLFFPSQQ